MQERISHVERHAEVIGAALRAATLSRRRRRTRIEDWRTSRTNATAPWHPSGTRRVQPCEKAGMTVGVRDRCPPPSRRLGVLRHGESRHSDIASTGVPLRDDTGGYQVLWRAALKRYPE
jgi:hypothetical protein